MFTLKIETDNAAFTDVTDDGFGGPDLEIARILRDVADKLENAEFYAGQSKTLRDINGNDVGRAKVTR